MRFLSPASRKSWKRRNSSTNAGITDQESVSSSRRPTTPFYNTSQFTLRDLTARASQQSLRADFEAYLDGYSPNVQDILDKFEFRNQTQPPHQRATLSAS